MYSAHKNTTELLKLLNEYNKMEKNYLYYSSWKK